MTSATPRSSANDCTRSYSGPVGPSGLTVYEVGLLRVTTRSSPVSRIWLRSGGAEEQVPISSDSVIMSITRKGGFPYPRKPDYLTGAGRMGT
jgi:hypothetical protein